MFENIVGYLRYQGYQTIKTNVEGISVNVQEREKESYIVVAFNLKNGTEFSKEQYHHLLDQVQTLYRSKNEKEIKLLSLICTNHPSAVRNYCVEDGITHWIVDGEQLRLIIYENQPQLFYDLKQQLDSILTGKVHVFQPQQKVQSERKKQFRNGVGLKNNISLILKTMPVCTISLILINVIVYLLVEITGSSEGTQHMVDWGASYYPLTVGESQYYRIITSMFLHFGWEHLFNNMLMLGLLGERFERIVGGVRFFIVYMASGILGGIGSIVYYAFMNGQYVVSAGASGAIFGIIGGVLALVILNHGRLAEITPARMGIFLLITLGGGLRSTEVDNAAHITGLITGFTITAVFYILKRKSGRIRR